MHNPDEYKIEVIMNPHTWDNPTESYFWCILGWCNDTWCNSGCGWSISPEQAWKDANKYFNRMNLRKQKENDNVKI